LTAKVGAGGLGESEGASLRDGVARGEDVMDVTEDDDGARPPTKRFGLAGELVVRCAPPGGSRYR
jgi:hypothetical protein